MRWRLVATTTIALAIVTTLAFARRSARLVYTRAAQAESCPDEAGFRSVVATRLGYDPFEADASAIVTASVARSAALESSVQFQDEYGRLQGEKKLASSSDDCVELTAAMALTISILLDPHAALGERESVADQAPPDRHESPFEPEVPPPPPPPARRTPPWRLRLGAETIASLGAAPAPAIGVGGFIGLGRGAVTLDLEARADVPASLTLADGTGVSSSLLLGTLAPCGHVGIFGFCGIASAGALHGAGLNAGTVGPAGRDATFYAAVGARAGLEVGLYRSIFARVHADAMLPLTRTTLKNRGVEYWTSPPVSGVLALGLGGQF